MDIAFGSDISGLLIAIILFQGALILSYWINSRIDQQEKIRKICSNPPSNDGKKLEESDLITRDNFIFHLIVARYAFEWDRSKILDSKASKMIGFIGVIITLETTIVLYIFKDLRGLLILPDSVREIIFLSILIGILCLFGSALLCLSAIYVRKWPIVPDTSHLIDNYTVDTVDIRVVMGATGKQVSDAIIKCVSQNDVKAFLLKIAYVLFFIGIVIIMAILYILIIVVYPQQAIIIN